MKLDEIILDTFLLSSLFLKTANHDYSYTRDGEKIVYSQKEKEEWDANELLDLSQLWAKYHGGFIETDIGCYLAGRGLVTIHVKDQHSSPEFNWKKPQEIDWLKPHTIRKSVLSDKGYSLGENINIELPSRRSD